MTPYNPANWYWIVGGSTTQVWASARAQSISVTDATYAAWLAAGGIPTRIDSEASLQQVFAQQFPAGWPGGDLGTQLGLGVTITSTGTPSFTATFACDQKTQSDFAGIAARVALNNNFPGGGTSYVYPDINGNPITIPTVALFKNFFAAYGDYLQGCSASSATAAATKAVATYPSRSVTIA